MVSFALIFSTEYGEKALSETIISRGERRRRCGLPCVIECEEMYPQQVSPYYTGQGVLDEM